MIDKVDKKVYYRLLENAVQRESSYSIAAKSDFLLSVWAESKESIYKLFGNQLKYSIPILTTADRETYIQCVNSLCDQLIKNKDYNLVRTICNVFLMNNTEHIDEIVNNVIFQKDMSFGGKTFKIGSKISKFFASLVPKKDKDEFNIIYSQFLQSLQTTGVLVVSIDPNDYLTMSENKNNWQSCHRLHGEFMAGTLSYMLDSHSVVAYLCSKNNVKYEQFNIEWNNKKWRQMVYLNVIEKYFIQSRQYPNINMINNNEVRQILTGILEIKEQEIIHSISTISDFLEDYDNSCNDGDDSLHYNDILKNSRNDFQVTLTHSKGMDLSNTSSMIIGNAVPCLNDDCNGFLNMPDHFVCYDCSDENNDDYYDDDYDK